MALVATDWSAELLLRSDADRTAWHFLSELGSSGVPTNVADFVLDVTKRVHDGNAKANRLLHHGMAGERQQMVEIVRHLEAQRAQIVSQYLSSTPRHCQLRTHHAAMAKQAMTAANAAARSAAAAGTSALSDARSAMEVRAVEAKGFGYRLRKSFLP